MVTFVVSTIIVRNGAPYKAVLLKTLSCNPLVSQITAEESKDAARQNNITTLKGLSCADCSVKHVGETDRSCSSKILSAGR